MKPKDDNVARQMKSLADPKTFDQIKEACVHEVKVLFLVHSTFEPLVDLLRASLSLDRIWLTADIGPYGCFDLCEVCRQLSDNSSFDYIYINVSSLSICFEEVEQELKRWQQLWNEAHEQFGCRIIQETFLNELAIGDKNSRIRDANGNGTRIARLNLALGASAPDWVLFNDVAALAADFGRSNWIDYRLYDFAKMPASAAGQRITAESARSIIAADFGLMKKCIVLDLDNTLWGGVVGEEGIRGIHVGQDDPKGEPYYRFQVMLSELASRGILLAICSKNDHDVAFDAFCNKEGMVLTKDHISAFYANWDSKTHNIMRIAEELNILLASMVFFDDSPLERELVKNTLPEVVVVETSGMPSNYASELSKTFLFESNRLTADDLSRTRMYREEQQRKTLFNDRKINRWDVVKSLKIEVTIELLTEHNERVLQLINKTNQFNLNGLRLSEREYYEHFQDENIDLVAVRASDRYGDYGIISGLLLKKNEAERNIEVLSWVLSCRVFERYIEEAITTELAKKYASEGYVNLSFNYIETPKNKRVKNFFRDCGMTESSGVQPNKQWLASLSNLSDLVTPYVAKII
ncbi:HAD-IIIC family phosphatase [Litorivicinus sp.]|nr:HAD-IIIC family phosphatase [Litorivicinus sp.]